MAERSGFPVAQFAEFDWLSRLSPLLPFFLTSTVFVVFQLKFMIEKESKKVGG